MQGDDSQRPWGCFEVLCEGAGHKVKRVTVHPGQRLSLQFHQLRTEHWFIVCGDAQVVCNQQELCLKAGDSVDIPQGAIHRIKNTGETTLIFIEVQQGEYLGEDDICRLEDDYRRCLAPDLFAKATS